MFKVGGFSPIFKVLIMPNGNILIIIYFVNNIMKWLFN